MFWGFWEGGFGVFWGRERRGDETVVWQKKKKKRFFFLCFLQFEKAKQKKILKMEREADSNPVGGGGFL